MQPCLRETERQRQKETRERSARWGWGVGDKDRKVRKQRKEKKNLSALVEETTEDNLGVLKDLGEDPRTYPDCGRSGGGSCDSWFWGHHVQCYLARSCH